MRQKQWPGIYFILDYKSCLSDNLLAAEALMELDRKIKDNEKVYRAQELGSYA